MNHYDKQRMQAGFLALYSGGPRIIFELLAELAEAHSIEKDVIARIDAWRDCGQSAAVQGLLDHYAHGKQFVSPLSLLP